MNNFDIIILAAGQGKRMKSDLPKVMHKICGKPMLEIILEKALNLNPDNIFVVVGYKKEIIEDFFKDKFKDKVKFVLQKSQLGTGDAVLCCKEKFLNKKSKVLILCGDMPLIREKTIKNFINKHFEKKLNISVLSTFVDNPSGYGRIIRDKNRFLKIVEEKDATTVEKKVNEINTGIYFAESEYLFALLENINNNNAQKEYYLTDIVELAVKINLNISAIAEGESYEFIGINSREHLSFAENILVKEKIQQLQINGVTFIKPDTTYIQLNVNIGKDTIIFPNNVILNGTEIGSNCTIGPFNVIKDSLIDNNVNIKSHCYIDSAKIGSQSQIGPFSHLRPDSNISENCKVGNFVEIKKSVLKNGVKASHLSYLGDAYIDEDTNIGAGTITCNYDGFKKYETFIGKNVFIGSDTQLVAPVKIGNNSLIAAGSTVTKNVPENSLVHSRVKQVNILNKGMEHKKNNN